MIESNLDRGTLTLRRHIRRSAVFLLTGFLVVAGTPVDASSDEETPKSTATVLTAGENRQIIESMTKSYGNPLTITAADFRSDGLNPTDLIHGWPDDGLWGSDNGNAFAVAPVYLPDGANIASVGVAVYDGYDGIAGNCGPIVARDVWAYLFRVNNYTGEAQQMSFFGTVGMDPDRQFLLDTDVEYPDIEYPKYTYYASAKVCHSAHYFYTMQIFFSMP